MGRPPKFTVDAMLDARFKDLLASGRGFVVRFSPGNWSARDAASAAAIPDVIELCGEGS